MLLSRKPSYKGGKSDSGGSGNTTSVAPNLYNTTSSDIAHLADPPTHRLDVQADVFSCSGAPII